MIPGGNVTIITDVALKNPTEEDIEFPPTATVVIGINEITKGEHGHSESEEEDMQLLRQDRQNNNKKGDR